MELTREMNGKVHSGSHTSDLYSARTQFKFWPWWLTF